MAHRKIDWKEVSARWIPLAIAIITVGGLAYVAVQQNYRMSANDPQIQVAEDYATGISQGNAAPDAIVPPNPTVDVATSLSPFLAIFSATTTPIGSSVAVNGKLPTLPSGVFDYVNKHGEDRFTWQPTPNVRIAAVVTKFSGTSSGYILAGRSLKEIENRIKNLGEITAVAILAALVLSLLAVILFARRHPEHHEHVEHPDHHAA